MKEDYIKVADMSRRDCGYRMAFNSNVTRRVRQGLLVLHRPGGGADCHSFVGAARPLEPKTRMAIATALPPALSERSNGSAASDNSNAILPPVEVSALYAWLL